MGITINIPGALRNYTRKESQATFEGNNVQELMDQFLGEYADLRKHLFQENGELRSFVNLFVNDEDIRHLSGMKTELKDGDEISIIPSIAGGFE